MAHASTASAATTVRAPAAVPVRSAGPSLRIEMVVHGLIAAGMEMVVARLTRGLVRRGHDVGITCIQFVGSLGERLRAEGVRVSLVQAPGIRSLFHPTPLRDWFRARRPDVVHVHSGAWLKAARGAATAGVPRVVYTLHGIECNEPWYEPFVNAVAARHTDAIAVVSEPLRGHLRSARIPADRIHVVPNGIDTAFFHPAAAAGRDREAFGLPRDRLLIGHVARFAPVKNHAFLVDAFARIHERVPAAYLVLAGDGPLRPEIERQVEAAGLHDHVRFTGDVEDPAPLYRTFDLFVLPSVTEGTSMSILEAMATGLPVVASAVGGTPDLLDRGNAGRLFPAAATVAFVDTVVDLLLDPVARTALGRRARERVIETYGEDTVLDRYESLYAGTATADRSATGKR
jgi:glycosyltransferase involved in cell wall biosynthesis